MSVIEMMKGEISVGKFDGWIKDEGYQWTKGKMYVDVCGIEESGYFVNIVLSDKREFYSDSIKDLKQALHIASGFMKNISSGQSETDAVWLAYEIACDFIKKQND